MRDPDVLTTLQAARVLGVSPARVAELLEAGLLQRHWHSCKGYVKGAARLLAWRAAHVHPWNQ